MRSPPDWREIVAFAVNEFGGPFTQLAMQPSSQPTRTRPRLSIVASKKSSKLRQVLSPQIGPRCTGSPGVTFCVVQVCPPSKVVATNRYQSPSNKVGSLFEPPVWSSTGEQPAQSGVVVP